MTIIGVRKITYTVSGALVAASVLAIAIWGLRLGIDFTGGSLMEIEFSASRPESGKISERLGVLNLDNAVIQPTGERGVIIRLPDLDEVRHEQVKRALLPLGEFQEKRFDSIGPTIGAELKRKSIWAIIVVMIMIIAYIAWAFRHVSHPMQSWKYGVAAVIALIHDVTIPTGVFAVLGRLYGVEVDTLFVTALLTILGFSVHDTIVVFDRIRENLKKFLSKGNFEEVVEKSIKDTVSRSINTSLTVMLVMLALYFFGGGSTKFFSLAILIGVGFGTYSSIFIASALLVTWHKWSQRRA